MVENIDLKKRDREIFNSQTKPDVFHSSHMSKLMYEKRQTWMAECMTSHPGSDDGILCLDVGCGGGFNTEWLEHYSGMVIGIDHSRLRIKNAQKRLCDKKKLNFLLADGEAPPLKRSSMDVIFCAAILHHLPDYLSALESYKKFLCKEGMVLATEPCAYNPFAFIRRKFFPSETHTPDERPFPPGELIKAFRQIFDTVYYKRFYLFSVNSPLVEKILGRRAAVVFFRIFSRIDALLLKIPLIKELCWSICIVGYKKA